MNTQIGALFVINLNRNSRRVFKMIIFPFYWIKKIFSWQINTDRNINFITF